MYQREIFLLCFLLIGMQSGCKSYEKEVQTQKEIPYQILEESQIPEHMKEWIREKKTKAFELTYQEDGFLYLGKGYGEQERDGYKVQVDHCLESEHFLHFRTTLWGSEKEEMKILTYPYVVVRVKDTDKIVLFE